MSICIQIYDLQVTKAAIYIPFSDFTSVNILLESNQQNYVKKCSDLRVIRECGLPKHHDTKYLNTKYLTKYQH